MLEYKSNKLKTVEKSKKSKINETDIDLTQWNGISTLHILVKLIIKFSNCILIKQASKEFNKILKKKSLILPVYTKTYNSKSIKKQLITILSDQIRRGDNFIIDNTIGINKQIDVTDNILSMIYGNNKNLNHKKLNSYTIYWLNYVDKLNRNIHIVKFLNVMVEELINCSREALNQRLEYGTPLQYYKIGKIMLNWCYENGLICKIANRYFEKLFEIVDVYTFIFGLLQLSTEKWLMCSNKICKCMDVEYGKYLSILKKEIQNIYMNDNILKSYYGQYEECDGAISHVWGDNLMLNYKMIYEIGSKITNISYSKLWLDVIQTEEFNAEKCRKEYKKNVYIISSSIITCPKIIPDAILFVRLLLSDWSMRGWISQEISSADKLVLILENQARKINNLDLIENTLQYCGYISNKLKDYEKYDILMKRVWRLESDILITFGWWANNMKEYKKGIIKDWLASSILCVDKIKRKHR